MADEYLTPNDVAEKLQVSVDTVYRLLDDPDESKRLPSVRIGKLYRIKVADFEAYLKNMATAPVTE